MIVTNCRESITGIKMGEARGAAECPREQHRQPPHTTTKHDWVPNVNSANVEKLSVTHRAAEVIKVTTVPEDSDTSVSLSSQILKLSPPSWNSWTRGQVISSNAEPHSGEPDAA